MNDDTLRVINRVHFAADPRNIQTVIDILINSDGYNIAIATRDWAIANIENAGDDKLDAFWTGITGKWKISINSNGVILLVNNPEIASFATLSLKDVTVNVK